MAHQDIRLRYQRSVLGPFWISLSLGALVLGIGFLYAEIFNTPWAEYCFFLASGLIAWTYISGVISDSASAVMEGSAHLRAVKISLPILAARVVYRNLIILAHNLVIGVIVVYVTGHSLNAALIWIVPGIALLTLFGLAVGLVIAPFCARYRDLPELIRNLVLMLFFLTPIFWPESQAGRRTLFIDGNPFNSLVNMVRDPLMGEWIATRDWALAGLFVLALCLLALPALAYSRSRVLNWL
ncbi:MAG: ABC transporter permease [Pseudomonadota bacterium]